MRVGVFISGTVHAGALLFTVFAVPAAFEPANDYVALPVELITIGEETNIMSSAEPAQEEPVEEPPEPEEPQPEQLAMREPEPEPEPEVIEEEPEIVPLPEEAEPEPAPEPEPEQVVKEEPPAPVPNVRPVTKPTPPPEPEIVKVEPEPEPEPEVPQDEFLADVAALLDKMPEEEKQPEAPSEPATEAAPNRGAGLQTALTVSEIDAFRIQMRKCWNVPAGAANSEELRVSFEVHLNPDGSLSRAPKLIESGQFSLQSNSFYRVAAESAARAIQRCAPYQMPQDKYQNWKILKLNFDPSQMLR